MAETKQWMVVIRQGNTWGWDFRQHGWARSDQPQPEANVILTKEDAEKDIFGILEAGGHVWDTSDTDLPEEDEDECYEAVSLETDGMSRDAMELLYQAIRATNPEDLQDKSLEPLWRDLRLPAEIHAR